MATLDELKQIQRNSTTPEPAQGDPVLPAEVVSAKALLGKIEVALWKEARQRLAGIGLPTGTTPEENQERNEAIGWAQREIDNSESTSRKVLKLLLAASNPTATPDQILAIPDAGIEAQVDALIRRLSAGFHPGR